MKANDIQHGGDHYKADGLQWWDFVTINFGGSFLAANAGKYILRWRKKNGVEDLRKAHHYVVKWIEMIAAGFAEPLNMSPSNPMLEQVLRDNELHQWDALMITKIFTAETEGDLAYVADALEGAIDARTN